MTRLKKLLREKPITLIVELIENDPAQARRFENLGADALFLKNIEGAEEILKAVKIPVGIDADEDLPALKPFDFVNFPAASADKLKNLKKTRVVCLDEDFSIDHLGEIKKYADAIDAAVIPLGDEVKDIMIGDLQNYISIVMSSDLPVIIPTQRSIRPSEVPIIADAGAKGLILNQNALGDSEDIIEKTFLEFKSAADELILSGTTH